MKSFAYTAALTGLMFSLAACSPSKQVKAPESQPAQPPQTTEQKPAENAVPTQEAEANTLYLDVAQGRITIELAADVAPKHAERIRTLAAQGFYDGIVFHRVIDGFMAQTGDPTGTGAGGSELPDLQAEFSDRTFDRGAIGMARSSNPNSANSQFFIMFDAAPHLNGDYTYVGRVTDGMDVVDLIKKGDSAANGSVANPDKIVKMRPADAAN